MNTWKRPPLNKQEKTTLIQHIKKGTYGETLKQLQKQKIITWASISNKIERQIDYVVINRRFRNSVRKHKQ